MSAKLIWITPDAEEVIAYCARVSNPANQGHHESAPKLIKYLLKHKHWSPLEMASACIEITTTRDIARQILRHRSFSYQEFSQRYQKPEQLPPPEFREARLQDAKNRQNSLQNDDPFLAATWQEVQRKTLKEAEKAYDWAISQGIAKEVARCVLPEGLTTSRMYMSGTIRSWVHYCHVRCGADTQLEHRQIANEISDLLLAEMPVLWGAAMAEVFDE